MLTIFEDDRLYPGFLRLLVVVGSEEEMVVAFRCSHTLHIFYLPGGPLSKNNSVKTRQHHAPMGSITWIR